MSQALFYPWIDITNETWLKTSMLYWDSVRTIVPESFATPYSTETGRALQDAGFLVPLRVRSDMYEVEDLADDVLVYLGTEEGAEMLSFGNGGPRSNMHVDSLPTSIGRLARIHPEKLPSEIRYLLQDLNCRWNSSSEWLEVNDSFANYYMTLLATRLAERVGAGLLTSLSAADRLAVAMRFDAQLPRFISPLERHAREYQAFGRRRNMPRQLAPGMLGQLAIEKMVIAPDTPVERIIEFRERHSDELAMFRTKIEQLTSTIDADLPIEALRQRIVDLHRNEVTPAVGNLKRALKGRRIRWMADGLLKVAFLSATSTSILVTGGLSVPTALLAGAGLSLIVTKAMYNVDKEDSLRDNPYAYLLSMEKELV